MNEKLIVVEGTYGPKITRKLQQKNQLMNIMPLLCVHLLCMPFIQFFFCLLLLSSCISIFFQRYNVFFFFFLVLEIANVFIIKRNNREEKEVEMKDKLTTN